MRVVVRQESKRPVRSDSWRPGPGRLTLADREEISLGLRAGNSFTAIAARLGKAVSTVSREVAANGGRRDYRAWRAHQRARAQARRPKPFKLSGGRLAAQVMDVSDETIYQSLFVQGRRDLRRDLVRCLRTAGSSGIRADAHGAGERCGTWS